MGTDGVGGLKMSSIILFDRNAQLDGVEFWRGAENGDF